VADRAPRARDTRTGASRTPEEPSGDKDAPGAPRASSVEQVVKSILQGLYQGRYAPGQRLAEGDLVRRYGVGRGSVREAIQRLAAEGVVTVNLHRGASIRMLSRQEALDILDVIGALAALSARRAAERLQAAGNAGRLRSEVAALSDAAAGGDPREQSQFYPLLAQLSGNQELVRLISTVHAHLIRVQFRQAYDTASGERQIAHYQRVLEAVLAGDGAKAERAVRQHLRRIATSIEQLPDEDFVF
jgi:DNA-binding GntR family transcriptional regulator